MTWWKRQKFEKFDGIINDGSIRSGKTLSMTTGFMLWSMNTFDGQDFAICGKTIGSLRRNVIKHTSKWLEGICNIKENRSENKLTITSGGHTNTYYLFGGRDESSYSLIQGMTLAGILLDEVALMPRTFVEEAIGRCSVTGSKFWFNCNPEGPSHWFYNEWIKKHKDKSVLYLHFTMDDNLSLSPEVKERYKKAYPTGVFYQRKILGLWVKAEGVIYKLFANNPNKYILQKNKDRLQIVSIGIDYGASRGKTTFKAVGINQGFRSVCVLSECDIEGIHEPEAIYRKFEEFYNQVRNQYGIVQYCFADYGALGQVITAGLISYLRRRGIPLNVSDCVKGTILDRISLVSQLMAQERFTVLDSCPNMIKALQEAVWDSDHEDVRLDDGTSDIDSLDAMEYAIYSFADRLIQRGNL